MTSGNRIFAAAICGLLCLSLSGCKPPPAMQQLEYQQDGRAAEDTPANLIENRKQNQQQDDSLSPEKQIPDSNNLRGQEKTLGAYAQDGGAAAGNRGQAPSADVGGSQQNQGGDSGAADGTQQQDIGENPSARQQPERQVVDSRGVSISLPQDIDRVAAAADAAPLVLMLGGEQRLAVSSRSLVENPMANAVWTDDGFRDTALLWADGGCMSDGAFEQLLKESPDICLEVSGQDSFSLEQIHRLKKANIPYVALPPLNTSANICAAVSLVGEMLGDRSGEGGINAPALAAEYCAYYRQITASVGQRVPRASCRMIDYDNDKNANGVKKLTGNANDTTGSFSGRYSLFLSGWDASARWSVRNNATVFLSGEGLAYTESGYSNSPLSYYMSLAGVVNTAATYPDFGSTQDWYVQPLLPSVREVEVEGNCALPDVSLTLTDNKTEGGRRENGLGCSAYPAVVVANQSLRDRLLDSPLWKSYPYTKARSGSAQDYGFLDRNGGLIESTIIADYAIWVNPSGAAGWTDGSPESILEPLWLAWKFYGAYTEEELRGEIRNFYQTFYRHALTEQQLNRILAGAE